jgi:hypothetical protein
VRARRGFSQAGAPADRSSSVGWRMSRSIVTRASSARRRLFSIRSALTCSLLTPRNWPAFSAFTQLASVCSTIPKPSQPPPPSAQKTPNEPPPACTPTYNAAASASPSQSLLRDYNSSLRETFSGGKLSVDRSEPGPGWLSYSSDRCR